MRQLLLALLILISSITFGQEFDIWGVPTGKAKTSQKITKENAPNAVDANGNKQGKWIKYNGNTLIYKGTFKNNKPVGEFLRYYPNGKLKAKQNFGAINDGSSFAQLYNNEGKLFAKGKYIGTLKDSVWTYFSSKGTILLKQTYTQDTLNGLHKKFFTSGKLYETVNYHKGIKEGEVKRYYEDGQIRLKASYSNDLLNGQYTTYYPNNKPEMRGNYKAGRKEGIWSIYNENGIVYMSQTYTNGELKNRAEINAKQQQQFELYEEKAGTFQDPQNYLNNPMEYIP